MFCASLAVWPVLVALARLLSIAGVPLGHTLARIIAPWSIWQLLYIQLAFGASATGSAWKAWQAHRQYEAALREGQQASAP